ncbi:MAG: tRNA (adenosine(37)-N6)-threonylcarbamoyltransferase complex dimerization subunit type 1 TsaB [Bacteroidales bacterium]|nr:tRNA (adenosine(37)-N6)-threonylcarbamoyltransferase complex dimerization subunit type 1 TsaB [Bacteroidales bacterium]
MAFILNIETATQVCSVALSANGSILQIRETREKNSHSSTITVFIEEIMKIAGMPFSALDAVAVSMGPGSYTGLRIGVSTAKGICYAIDKPLIAVGTLQSMATGILKQLKEYDEFLPSGALLCPMIDARRMEVYNGLYDMDLKLVRDIRAEIIIESSFTAELDQHQVWFFGDGAEKCNPMLGNHPHARFINDFQLSASYMVSLAEEKFSRSEFEDVVYFEPYYLKDFIPGITRVKGLNK